MLQPQVLALILGAYVVMITMSNFVEAFSSDVVMVMSNVDQSSYLVRNLADKEEAANKLAELKSSLVQFVKYLQSREGQDERVQRLVKRYQPDKISESSPDSNYTSYSVNKGEKVFMCVRQRDENNTLIDNNTLLFVALHELAHIMTVSKGHTDEFWTNFKFLLHHAIEGKIYQYQAFHKQPVKYCGVTIRDTPHKL